MALDDKLWRALVNSLPELSAGADPPEMESITPPVPTKKRPTGRKFLVQKIITEIYVYTDVDNRGFSEATFQDLVILGEMTEAKLNKLLRAQVKKRNKDVDTE